MPEILTLCARGCPDACQMTVKVEGGRAVSLAADENNPYTRGLLCASQEKYLQRVYHPQRILHPHIKTGESYATWVRRDIPFVLNDLVHRITRALADQGPLSILHVQGATRTGWSSHLNRMFFRLLGGTSTLYEDPASSPGTLAFLQDFGAVDSPDPREILNSRLILLWSHNPYIRNEHWVPILSYAHKQGAKIVLIDPVYSPAVKMADAYYQVRPGTEGHLALALAHCLVKNSGTDTAFLKAHVGNAHEFLSVALAAKVELLAAQCDLSLSTVENLARLMATAKPVSMILGDTLEGYLEGTQALRLINSLSALTGQVGIPGGGPFFRNQPKGLDLSFIDKVPVRQERELDLGEIMEGKLPSDPPIRVAFINRTNPVFSLPDGVRFWRFLREIPTVVLFDMFFTDTSDAASHFLPVPSILEEDDLVTSPWHKGVGVAREVLAPRGEARSEFFWYRRLARRLDLKDLDKPLGYFLNLMTGPLRARGITLEKLGVRMALNPLESKVAFAERIFSTPSGKIELITHTDLKTPAASKDFPLLLIPLPHRDLLDDQALPEEIEGLPLVAVHPETLSALGLGPDQEATVVSPLGHIRVLLAADPFQRKDVLIFPRGRSIFREDNVMSLLPFRRPSSGTGCVLYDTRVRLIK
jgi:anaerobic selenocysteine-containing dehydrogenase